MSEYNKIIAVVHKYLCLCSFSLCLQFKRHKTKQHTKNFAKSVVNLVDAVSELSSYPLKVCAMWTCFSSYTNTVCCFI